MYINNLITGSLTLGSGGSSSSSGHPETRVKYTEASGITPREQTFNIEGELTYSSIDNMGDVEEIDIGNTVTSIGDQAFDQCSNLTSITIPEGVESIGLGAFYCCSGLTSITIPNSVTNIYGWSFEDCSGLTSVTFLGKTLEQVQAMDNYNDWCIDPSIINVA